jgi:uncharacterized protein (DUF4415 family)
MTENKRAIATDLKRLDAHVIQPAEYEDAPELTDKQLAEASTHEGGKLVRRGRPPSPSPKQAVKLRLDPQILEAFRATGPGWQTLMNAVLLAVARFNPSARLALARLDPSDPDWRTRVHALLRAMKAAKAKKKAPARRASGHRSVRSVTQRPASRLHG